MIVNCCCTAIQDNLSLRFYLLPNLAPHCSSCRASSAFRRTSRGGAFSGEDQDLESRFQRRIGKAKLGLFGGHGFLRYKIEYDILE